MASMEEIKKELIEVLQKEIDQNSKDQESARSNYEKKRDAIDEEVKELESLQGVFIDAQNTGRKLKEVFESVQATFPDPVKPDPAILAEAEAATIEVRK